MPDITAAVDESAASKLLAIAEAAVSPQNSGPGGGALGALTVTYSAQVAFSGGNVSLSPPNLISIAGCNMAYTINLSLSVDISKVLPQICIPPICILNFCTPQFCIPYPPPIPVTVTLGDTVTFTADFHLKPHLAGSDWFIDVVIDRFRQFQFGAGTAAALVAIAAAVTKTLAVVPPYGPVAAIAIDAALSQIGVAGLEGFLEPILTPFIAGLTLTIYRQPQIYPAIPAAGPFDPVVNVTITALNSVVLATDKNGLVVTASIAG